MLEIFEKNYYIDIDSISEKCQIQVKKKMDDGEENDENSVLEINVFKYDIIKMCIDRIFAEFNEEPEDEDYLLRKEIKTTPSFGIAFNTLINYDIIKEKYE